MGFLLFYFAFCLLSFVGLGALALVRFAFFAWRFKSVVYALGAIALLALFLLFK